MIKNKRYNNYHKHTTKSSIFSPDTHIQAIEYFKRAKELGHNTYFTTEHGFGGDIFEAVELSQMEEFKGIKSIFAIEGYIVPNPLEKDNSNYHIMLIARTDKARKKLNKINSRANKEGYYYRPRIFLEDLLSLDKDDIYITTACVAGIIRDKRSIKEIFLPLHKHFKQSLMVEVQSHLEDVQIRHNKNAIFIANKFNLRLIHANDSHYIYPEQADDRLEYLKGKGITYGDEDNFVLDYPDYDEIVKRYKKQGVLSDAQIEEALDSTLLFDDCEAIQINKKIKMPNIYKNLTPKERYEKLEKIIINRWQKEKENIDADKHDEYIDAINFESNIIKETNEEVHTADYFLLNERMVDLAVNKYGGKLTKTGRGSGVSFYINKLLGFTGIDRLALNVPIYPTRFISKSRLLDSRSLPDFDFNTSNPEPFIRATKDLLGENGCYRMIAYGTMKESEAFRNTCRHMGMKHDEYNEVAKNLDEYRDDKHWGKIIKHSEKFIGSIVSASPHPCAFLLMDKDIEEEIGVIKVGDELCAVITSTEADKWKYLKNDYLTVLVVEIINDTFELLNQDVLEVNELLDRLDDDVWNLYRDGITATLNQTDSDFATSLIMQYKPTKYEELSSFVAAIRPGFASLLNTFINRQPYSNGVEALDNLLESTDHFMLYQENVMSYLVWLGVPEDITYDIVKKIAKKTFTTEELNDLHEQLLEKWIERVGTEDGFAESWKVVEDNAEYSFNASHSISVAIDSLYGAYLKAKHPLEYYTVVLEKYRNDAERTHKLTKELEYFGITLKSIKFRHSSAKYTMNKKTNSIYKGVASIKYLNEQVGNELYDLRNNKYDTFYDLLVDLTEKTSINSRQLTILITLNFFDEFGKNKKLLEYTQIFNELYGIKQLSKAKAERLNLPIQIIKKYSRETPKTYMDFQYENVLKKIWYIIEDVSLSLKEQIQAELEYLNYIEFTEPRAGNDFYVVIEYKTYKNKLRPYVTLYRLKTGEQIKTKVVDSKFFAEHPFELYDVIRVKRFKTQRKNKFIDGKWVKSDETEQVLNNWQVF